MFLFGLTTSMNSFIEILEVTEISYLASFGRTIIIVEQLVHIYETAVRTPD